MAGRSLRLSATGQQQARQALLLQNLTQKAIANEQVIASWSTVNRFFNGKPVDRFIFQEICDLLNLDWQEVAAMEEVESGGGGEVGSKVPDSSNASQPATTLHPPISPSPHSSLPPHHPTGSSDLLASLQAQATAAREALTPRILERIPRKVVREKYLEAIARGTQQGKERLIAIIGPAGYGKSTILGDIYDELVAVNTPWVGLVLCSNLSFSTGYLGFMSYGLVASTSVPTGGMGSMPTGPSQNQQDFVDNAMGQSLCGETRSAVDICRELTQTLGRGVLLIDTLDLVVNRDFVVVFGALMRQMVAQGTTVLFTCRDHEYHDYLEPVSQRLPGLTQAMDRYAVPNFSTAEIRAAATRFMEKLAPTQPGQGRVFADKVLALSADNRSLREILENPLLLALLCDLFGQDGNVPPDLTVSKLYQRYWHEKIAYSRIDQSHFAPLAIEKENLCLHIAQRLYELSDTRLYESFYRDDLGLNFTPPVLAAYNDLLSEGVLTQLSLSKVHFFHQTLLEYAIAYWLTRQSAASQRDQFFAGLKNTDSASEQTHWLPVLRQFLAIVDDAEFEQWVAHLPLEHMGIFGAVAYAAASRDRSDALQGLLPIALQLGEPHQRRLQQALMVAPRPLIEANWDVWLVLLRQAEHVTAGNLAELVGILMERWWSSLQERLGDTVAAIAARSLVVHLRFPNGYDDRTQLLGRLLKPCLPLIQNSSEPEILAVLRHHIDLLGHATAAGVIQSHREATPDDQRDLLQRLLQHPVPRYEDIKQALFDFVADLLPHHLDSAQFPLGNSWVEVLHQPQPDQWELIQVKAVGRWAARDEPIYGAILQDYLFGAPEQMGRNLKALLESMVQGAGDWLLPQLKSLAAEQVEALPWNRFSQLLPSMTDNPLTGDDQEDLAQWLLPHVPDNAAALCPVLNILADASPTARQTLMAQVDSLPPKQRQILNNQLLRFQPIEDHPPLSGLKVKDQRFLISFYQQQAFHNPLAVTRLMQASLSQYNDAAVAASQGLVQLAAEVLDVNDLLPLLNSRFVGVRVNGLSAVSSLSQQVPLSIDDITQICHQLQGETNPTVIRHFCDLGTQWMKQTQTVLPVWVTTLNQMLERTAAQKTLEGGLGRSFILALKFIAQTASAEVSSGQITQVVRRLLLSLSLMQVKSGEAEMIDLLCALHRLDSAFLINVVEQDFPALMKQDWLCNVSTVIKAARRLEGPASPLLDEVMQRYSNHERMVDLVLEAKGT